MTKEEVLREPKRTNAGKAAGPDRLKPGLLKTEIKTTGRKPFITFTVVFGTGIFHKAGIEHRDRDS